MTINNPLRAVFMGTPDFAARILHDLAKWGGVEILAVYCREDKPVGRGHKIKPPEVKITAQKLNIPVRQPKNFKDTAEITALSELKPDFLLVAAYGLILPQAVLDIPRLGSYNVHASLLPKYRGAAPIQRAIMDGCSATGITIMHIEADLDAGPIISQKALGIGEDDTAASLSIELADMGSRLLIEMLKIFQKGETPKSIVQNNSLATYAARLEKKDGFINWEKDAFFVHNLIRGTTPWPGAQSVIELPNRPPMPVFIMPGRIYKDGIINPAKIQRPGTIVGLIDNCLAVACNDFLYLISELKPPGKKNMSAGDFVNGYMSGQDYCGFMRMPDSCKL